LVQPLDDIKGQPAPRLEVLDQVDRRLHHWMRDEEAAEDVLREKRPVPLAEERLEKIELRQHTGHRCVHFEPLVDDVGDVCNSRMRLCVTHKNLTRLCRQI
jgi:hypothetical protein